MEQWNKGNKMIRKIGEKEDPFEYTKLCVGRLNGMEELAATHITWYTHKNPYGCWICDLFLLTRRALDSFEEFLGPGLEEKVTTTTTSLDSDAEHEEGDSENQDEEEGEPL